MEVANFFQLTRNNNDGSQKLVGQELPSGCELYIRENDFLRTQNQQLLDKIGSSKQGH